MIAALFEMVNAAAMAMAPARLYRSGAGQIISRSAATFTQPLRNEESPSPLDETKAFFVRSLVYFCACRA
jgi:hypothetical protein